MIYICILLITTFLAAKFTSPYLQYALLISMPISPQMQHVLLLPLRYLANHLSSYEPTFLFV